MKLRVVVLSCQSFGIEMARAIKAHPDVEVVELIKAPLPRRSFKARLKQSFRAHGIIGTLRNQASRVISRLFAGKAAEASHDHESVVPVREFSDLHAPECLEYIRASSFDVGVVDGTGILKASLFNSPRLGSINLHCGRLPDYRGAPPAFWELMNGETSCGVSVHEVTDKLDAGLVLAEDSVPLDPAPPGDPVQYAQDLWRTQLRPRGIQLVLQTLSQIATDSLAGREQSAATRSPNRTPTHEQQQQLRAIVARRRSERDADGSTR